VEDFITNAVLGIVLDLLTIVGMVTVMIVMTGSSASSRVGGAGTVRARVSLHPPDRRPRAQ
jgi:hypothetical protein